MCNATRQFAKSPFPSRMDKICMHRSTSFSFCNASREAKFSKDYKKRHLINFLPDVHRLHMKKQRNDVCVRKILREASRDSALACVHANRTVPGNLLCACELSAYCRSFPRNMQFNIPRWNAGKL